MHRLEITGETPEALYFNVVKTLSIFLRGAQSTNPVETVPGTTASSAGAEVVAATAGSTPADAVQGAVEAFGELISKSKKRGRAKASTDTELPKDDISDVGKTIEHDPQNLTLDGDIRPRLRAIQKACTERGLDMPKTITYIQKLYGPFGIAKAEQLKTEQFAEFMEASDGYLSGEA